MESIRERARNRFPSVLLTLLSIIQALALEFIWSSLKIHPHLWQGGLPAVIGWLQVSAIGLGIVVVWLFYTSLVMRLLWVPTVRDSILPFVIGVSEFLMIELLAPGYVHWWAYVLAGMFALCFWTSSSSFYRARLEEVNADFYKGFDKSTYRQMVVPMSSVLVIALGGVAVQRTTPDGTAALATALIANVALLVQMATIHRYWNQSLWENEAKLARENDEE